MPSEAKLKILLGPLNIYFNMFFRQLFISRKFSGQYLFQNTPTPGD